MFYLLKDQRLNLIFIGDIFTMRRFICFISIAILFMFSYPTLQAQGNGVIDSSAYQIAKTYFQNIVGAESHLYTGEAYPKYDAGIKGDPFFMVTQMQNGDIFYDGSLYKDVPMLYDISRDKIIINRYNGNERIQLLTEKIKYLAFEGHKFENFATTEGKEDNISKKLYDVLFNGKATLLVQRIKNIKHGLKAEDPYSFVEEDAFFIRNENNLFVVNNRNDVLPALNDKKNEVKAFIRKNRLKFKKNKEGDLIKTVNYYESLNK